MTSNMNDYHRYDLIVIGRDMSSLIAGLASARQGLRTLLIDEGGIEPAPGEGGYTFPVDQAPLSGLAEGQTVQRLLRELNLPPAEAPHLMPMDPAFQIILSGHRLDLFQDQERLIGDLIRELPQEEKEIRRFYQAVAKSGPLIDRWIGEDVSREPQDLHKRIKRLFRIPSAIAGSASLSIRENKSISALRRIMEAQMTVLSHLDHNRAGLPLSAAYLYSLPTRGLFYPVGGRNALKDWIVKGFNAAGGILMDRCSVMRIDTDGEIGIALESSAGEPMEIKGRTLIASALWEKLNLLLLQEKPFRRYGRRLAAFEPSGFPFFLHLGVHESGLPEQLAPYVVVVGDEAKPASGINCLFVETSLPGERSRAPQGRRAIMVKVFLKASPLLLNDPELKAVAKGIIDSLDGLLPFLRDSIDYLNIDRSIALSRQYQEIVNHKYCTKRCLLTGMTTLSPKTPHPHIFLTGGIFRAGLGFEGEILSGMDSSFFAGKKVQVDG
jgi:phytoene dehydrogenase-like protein